MWTDRTWWDNYDQVMYVDSDVIALPHAPNIFVQYPDIDNVPDFNDISLSDEEIMDYCSNLDTDQTKLEKCITDLKNKNYE